MNHGAPLTNSLQRRLETLYDFALPHQVSDFLLHDPLRAAELRPAGSRELPEQLLIRGDEDELALSLYLAPEVMQTLAEANPEQALEPRNLQATLHAIEGVSHFVCLSWHALAGRSCSALHLELQAEVDKYALLSGLLLEQQGLSSPHLLAWLFESTRFDPDLSADEQVRYRTAHRLAARFCQALARRVEHRIQHPLWRQQLRRYYRLPQPAKLAIE